MLPGKLVHLIERHEEQITARIVWSIHHHPELPRLGTLSELELRERCREILENLGHWLARGNEAKLAAEYEAIGRLRFTGAVPLEECVRGLYLIRDNIVDFLDSQGIDPDSFALYAESQLVRRIGPFFDLLVIHLVRGYETERRHAAYTAA